MNERMRRISEGADRMEACAKNGHGGHTVVFRGVPCPLCGYTPTTPYGAGDTSVALNQEGQEQQRRTEMVDNAIYHKMQDTTFVVHEEHLG